MSVTNKISLIFVLLLSGCGFDTGNLDLLCKGITTRTINNNGKVSTSTKEELVSLHFKDKKMYRLDDEKFISKTCEVWTRELIVCQRNEDGNSPMFGAELRVDRTTGEYLYYLPFKNGSYRDDEITKGVCEVGKKL